MAAVKGLALVVALAFISCIFTTSEGRDTPADKNIATPWCIANATLPDYKLRVDVVALCDAPGVDCALIRQGGPCYGSNDVKLHASVVFNQYYQATKNKNSCNFFGHAMLTFIDPSTASCKFLKASST